ncbi:hypothetical protein [Paraburkholderia phytofirmans]|uniref:hypothetical protein n=1 Tax=Paraburkholderia phytofirmans TaxID=261302 RepID=UPI0015E87C2F|nr:hypothetical protein [Paraburkholderia phytofirmans]
MPTRSATPFSTSANTRRKTLIHLDHETISTLLEKAVLAHGGIDNWNKFRSVCATLDISGATIPFLYTLPGFKTEELPEWEEDGQVWRRLKVTFPESIVIHSREQISYFGEDGLLRRHDYTVDVMGGASGANYASNYRDIGGIIVPTERRVYAYDDSGQKVDNPLLVSIDFSRCIVPRGIGKRVDDDGHTHDRNP